METIRSGETVLGTAYSVPEENTGWLVAYSQHRDSDSLTESNFRVMVRSFDPETQEEDWTITSLRNAFYGWVELLIVRPGSPAEQVANKLTADMEDYPVLDEMDWSELEWEENHPEADDLCYSEDDDCPCGREKA